MEGDDIANLIMLGGDEFLQIWGATHGGDTAPPPRGTIVLPGVQAQFNPNLVIVGLIIVGLVLVMNRA